MCKKNCKKFAINYTKRKGFQKLLQKNLQKKSKKVKQKVAQNVAKKVDKKKKKKEKRQTVERNHRVRILAPLYTIIEKQNQCHSTKVKKSYFCHTFHPRPKQVFWWWVKSDFSVSLCPFCSKIKDQRSN